MWRQSRARARNEGPLHKLLMVSPAIESDDMGEEEQLWRQSRARARNEGPLYKLAGISHTASLKWNIHQHSSASQPFLL